MTYIVGTRGSALARAQSQHIVDTLQQLGIDAQLRTITTHGDVSGESLSRLGGVGVFAAQLRVALLEGACDLAIHSYKDLPTREVPGLTIACTPVRASSSDALCGAHEAQLHELPRHARVGTGSPRRAAQLLALRPDLRIVDIRGNVPTRLGRVAGSDQKGPGDLDAVVVALAGLERLGLAYEATDIFGPERLLPAPAQGVLAIEVATQKLQDDPRLASALARIHDPWTYAAATAERAVLATLDAGCAAPVGTWCAHMKEYDDTHNDTSMKGQEADTSAEENSAIRDVLALDAAVIATDGTRSVNAMERIPLQVTHTDRAEVTRVATELGTMVGKQLLALGAADITDLHASTSHRGPTSHSFEQAHGRDRFGRPTQ